MVDIITPAGPSPRMITIAGKEVVGDVALNHLNEATFQEAVIQVTSWAKAKADADRDASDADTTHRTTHATRLLQANEALMRATKDGEPKPAAQYIVEATAEADGAFQEYRKRLSAARRAAAICEVNFNLWQQVAQIKFVLEQRKHELERAAMGAIDPRTAKS